MRPSSLGGGRIMRRTLSVRPSVCLSVRLSVSVCPSVPLSLPSVTSRHLANYNDTHVLSGTRWGHPYFSARTEGRISYGHLGRTNYCFYLLYLWYCNCSCRKRHRCHETHRLKVTVRNLLMRLQTCERGSVLRIKCKTLMRTKRSAGWGIFLPFYAYLLRLGVMSI